MTIKEVEKKLNISRANIRYYEKEGLLEPKRNDNEYRNYSEDDLKRLEQILLFRKCDVSIENIRLVFNGVKRIDEVFSSQITVIENEVKQLEGAKIICKKLAQENVSLDNIDTNKYINMINNEEQKGNKFNDISKDYIMATENLYQSIIENEKFKGGEKMKKWVKAAIYALSFVLTTLLLGLFDLLFYKRIDWEFAICFSAILTVTDLISVKKYIEDKSGEKFTKKDNIKHFIITILMMIVSLLGLYIVKTIKEDYKNPKENILELSVKKSLIEIANTKFSNIDNYIPAESHKILSYEVRNNEIYVYLVANYGIINPDDCKVVEDTKNPLTIIYTNTKNSSGIYELKEYQENSLPDTLKDKMNVNYEDNYFQEQLNKYCNK